MSRALSLAAVTILTGLFGLSAARAENLEAGKSPQKIFADTCSACHKSSRGLLRSVSPGSLPGFLRQHYTTSSDMASALSGYLVSSGGATERVVERPGRKDAKRERDGNPAPPASVQAGDEPAARPKPTHPDADGRSVEQRTAAPQGGRLSAKQKRGKKGAPAEPETAKQEQPKAAPTPAEAPKTDAAKIEEKPQDKPAASKPDDGKAETAKSEPPASPIVAAPPASGAAVPPPGGATSADVKSDGKPGGPSESSNPGAEAKREETKRDETKRDEAKPAEAKSAEPKSADPKPAETKPAETKADEAKAGETKAGETKPGEANTREASAPLPPGPTSSVPKPRRPRLTLPGFPQPPDEPDDAASKSPSSAGAETVPDRPASPNAGEGAGADKAAARKPVDPAAGDKDKSDAKARTSVN